LIGQLGWLRELALRLVDQSKPLTRDRRRHSNKHMLLDNRDASGEPGRLVGEGAENKQSSTLSRHGHKPRLKGSI
jgi:hypothetical protein